MEFTIPSAINAVTSLFDASRWENEEPKKPEVVDLGLTGEQIQQLLQLPYGVSELRKNEFPHLTRRNGKMTSTLKASFVFEHLRRDTQLAVVSASLGCTCNTAYQNMVKVRVLWETALGLRITLTQDGAHLTQDNEVALRARRLAENALKLETQARKLHLEAQSVERATGQNLLGPATQNLLTAMLDERLTEEVGNE